MVIPKSMTRFCWKSVLVVLTFAAGAAYADTFEFLTFTPPPGWTKQASGRQTVYQRPTGIGMISFIPSYQTVGLPADEFAKIWAGHVGTTLRGPTPPAQVERLGSYTVAIGGTRVNAQGTLTTISLVAFVGQGRSLGVLGMAAGDEAERELVAFFDTLREATGTTTSPNSGSVGVSGVDVDFDVPAGYSSQRDGNMIVLKPTTLDRNTPCIYGISPARVSTGKLDIDAANAILEALPGWQTKSDHYNAMRGTSGDGWPYYWLRTDVARLEGPSYKYLTAMTMAFPAGRGRVNIIWGFGATGVCTLDDHTFTRLFHSLKPRGWTSDTGKTFAAELLGTWRNTESVGMAQYRFLPGGRFEYGQGTSTTFSTRETRTGSVAGGRYELRGGELIMTGGRGAEKFRARIYDEFSGGKWLRTLSLTNENSTPPLHLRFMRVEDSR
jgi:hypothetical protein